MGMPRGRRIAIVAVVLAVSAAAATGITYAAGTTTSKVVYACANAKGTLRLLSKGKCPIGYLKVGINKRGPRGPRGLTGSTGPAGPGAMPLHAASTNATIDSVETAIPGMGLTALVQCSAGVQGVASILYFIDKDASANYTVLGSYDLSAPGAHAHLEFNGGTPGDLATGLGTVDYLETKQLNGNSALLLSYDSGTGGDMTADVAVARAGKTALVHV